MTHLLLIVPFNARLLKDNLPMLGNKDDRIFIKSLNSYLCILKITVLFTKRLSLRANYFDCINILALMIQMLL